jgi:hypothetical protein
MTTLVRILDGWIPKGRDSDDIEHAVAEVERAVGEDDSRCSPVASLRSSSPRPRRMPPTSISRRSR